MVLFCDFSCQGLKRLCYSMVRSLARENQNLKKAHKDIYFQVKGPYFLFLPEESPVIYSRCHQVALQTPAQKYVSCLHVV